MTNDPIRARLDEIWLDPHADPAPKLDTALRAVLDLLGEVVCCAHYEDPVSVREDEIRQAIAVALGVQP